MINYQEVASGAYIKVKWKKTELGRIYKEGKAWHYRPRGCDGAIRSEEFYNLAELKDHLEGK